MMMLLEGNWDTQKKMFSSSELRQEMFLICSIIASVFLIKVSLLVV